MSAFQRFVMVSIFILVVALPGGGAFLYYHFTKDPLFQPLGITRERLAELDGQTEFVSIGVHVDWGRDRTDGMTSQVVSVNSTPRASPRESCTVTSPLPEATTKRNRMSVSL